jgi:DNA-binding transcriptional MerR regulator
VTDELITIGTFSLLTGLSITTLRHYDDIGLLHPTDVHPRTGYRRYAIDLADRAHRIRMLRSVEMSPEDMELVLDGDEDTAGAVMARHRDALADRGTHLAQLVGRLNDYIEEGLKVQAAKDIRIIAINIGVPSEEALHKARTFWEAVLGVKLENWGGPSWQVLLGPDGAQGMLNIRIRSADEAHHAHTSAFGISVPDLQVTAKRAIAAGGKEHYPPTEGEDMPSHTLIEDPVGNRVVFWQA